MERKEKEGGAGRDLTKQDNKKENIGEKRERREMERWR